MSEFRFTAAGCVGGASVSQVFHSHSHRPLTTHQSPVSNAGYLESFQDSQCDEDKPVVMRLPSVLAAHGRRFRVVLINTVILSVLALSISSQWWTNGFPGSVSPAEYRGPYLYHHDQTLAVVHFQADGKFITQVVLT